ncbi:type IX secretion system PorP/SprF family membrane protein [Chitinophaga niastensis]|uniref:Type IX secretion system PorP/SprF family membrane protein n=1 Tax=Chitinophaga niastensis TaxID=536980 RepID=A0A2P8HA87_CHINA|nr:PorP/SprF family type IX secretion system membrane protein [Chitinophaga niastensis]PSL43110.1 type IX secretion system PorP/SprF family membrane protein [Chitinophaga niastensis]
MKFCTPLYAVVFFLMTFSVHTLQAQTVGRTVSVFDPPAAQYFFNQYLANPAMAGLDSGIHINVSYRRPSDGIPGAPVTQTASVDAYMGHRVGAGFNVYNDKAGLLQRTKAALTYAYHLPVGMNDQSLSFGLSLAVEVQRLNIKDLNGDMNDPSLGAFNRRDNYFESDFGMAYTDHHFTIQVAMPNLIGQVKNDEKNIAGLATFFSAAAYKFNLGNEISGIEPKVCYRGVRGEENIIDAGANIGLLNDWANVFGMYHSSGSVSAGAGFNYKSFIALQAVYITQTTGYSTIMANSFEINLRLNIR